MFGLHQVLVVDDRPDEGMRVVETLWQLKGGATFVRYDPKRFQRAGRLNHRGVRVIFMDIDLLGAGVTGTGSQVFTTVQQAITWTLSPDNGPYVLVSWTAHDDHAARLFEHLNARLPEELRPVSVHRLKKEDFDGRNRPKLGPALRRMLKDLGSVGCLMAWEQSVQIAASDTTNELTNIARTQGPGSIERRLSGVLKSLARAQAAEQLTDANAVRSLCAVLAPLLHDTATRAFVSNEKHYGPYILAGPDGAANAEWKRRVNYLLHIDDSSKSPIHTPGAVLSLPGSLRGIPVPGISDRASFVVDNFLPRSRNWDAQRRSTVGANCALYLTEITPPCDYAQNKHVWHKYVVTAKIPSDLYDECKVDFLMRSPNFVSLNNADSFFLAFNARLIVSIPRNKVSRLRKREFRVREPLFADVLGWLGRQNSRLGHDSVT